MGKQGVGKNSFINILLQEKKCKTGIGNEVLTKILKYIYNEYPINIYDSPGFKTDKEFKNIGSFLEKLNDDLYRVKDKIHLFIF